MSVIFAQGAPVTNLLTLKQVEQYAIQAGFPTIKYESLGNVEPYRVAAAIAMVEGQTSASRTKTGSTGTDYTDADAVGDQNLANTIYGYSYGFMQVRSLRSNKGTGKTRDEDRLLEPLFNMQSAYTIWREQRAAPNPPVLNGVRTWAGFEPWSTYKSLKYQAYLGDVFKVPPTLYVVKAGDTLSLIASRQKMGIWQDWQQVNQLPDPNLIGIGEKLEKPWWSYTVANSDTFASLASLNRLKTATLRTFNKRPSGEPAVGSTVLIPHRLLTRKTP